MKKQTLSLILFWIGLAIAILFTIVGTWNLMGTLRNLSMQEVGATMWDLDRPANYLCSVDRIPPIILPLGYDPNTTCLLL